MIKAFNCIILLTLIFSLAGCGGGAASKPTPPSNQEGKVTVHDSGTQES